MFKRLLSIAALAATFAFNANADVLWESTDAEGVLVDWGQPCVALSADQVVDAIAPGDFIEVTTAGVTEGGWPQVALFGQFGGWPPLASEGVGGKEYPYVTSFPVTNELYAEISENGLSVSGNGAYVSGVELVKGDVEIGPNTVWFGNKACGWGNGVSLPASLFADVKVGDKLAFYVDGVGFQVLLGGWDGLNLPCYEFPEGVTYEDGVATFTMLEKYAETNDYDDQELNVFVLMKANGVVMHGTVTVTRIDYIPAPVCETYVGHPYLTEDYNCIFSNYSVDVKYYPEESTVVIEGWNGYADNDLKVVFDENDNIVSLTTITDGEESEPISGYFNAYLNNPNYYYIQPYIGDGYCYCGADEESGYLLLQAYFTDNEDNQVWADYYIEWPLELPEVEELSTIIGAETGIDFVMDCDLTVLYAMSDDTAIVSDGKSCMPAFLDEFSTGDLIDGGWLAIIANEFDNEPVGFDFLMPQSQLSIKAGEGFEVEPVVNTAEDATSTQSQWGYVCITGVELDEEGVEAFNEGDAAIVEIDDENMFLVANGFKNPNLIIEAPGKYNIVGFWMPQPEVELLSRGEGAQFVLAPIDIYNAVVTFDSFSQITDIEAGQEVKIACSSNVIYSEDGFTVLQDENKCNAAVILDGAAAGDVLAGGWTGVMGEDMPIIRIMTEDIEEYIIPGMYEPAQPTEIEAYNIFGTQAPWQYVKILNVYLDEDAIADLQDMGNAYTEDGIIIYTEVLPVDVENLEVGTYNITGFWMQGEANDVTGMASYALLPIAFEAAQIVIEDFNALTDVPEDTIVTLGFQPIVVANYSDMNYMLWDGQNFMPYANFTPTWEETLKPGDVLAAGWTPMFSGENSGLSNLVEFIDYDNYVTIDPEVVSSGAELPTPIEVEADNFQNVAYTPWGYVTLMSAEYDADNFEATFADETFYIWDLCEDSPFVSGTYNVSGFLKNTDEGFIFYATKYDKPTGINGVGVDDNAAEYYNLQGVKVSKPAAGRAYIRVQNGKAVKVVK